MPLPASWLAWVIPAGQWAARKGSWRDTITEKGITMFKELVFPAIGLVLPWLGGNSTPVTYDCYGSIISGGDRAFTITITPGTFHGSGIIELPAANIGEIDREITDLSVSESEDFYRLTHPGNGRGITIVIDRNSGISRMTRSDIHNDFKCDKTPRRP